MKIYNLFLIVVIFLLSSCGEEELPKPYRIAVESQEDVDQICDLLENGEFDGSIIAVEEDTFDFSCFENIRRVNGNFINNAPNGTKYLYNLEYVGGLEGFIFEDVMADTIYFPNLKQVNGTFGQWTIGTWSPDVVIVPQLEIAFQIRFGTYNNERLTYIEGMNNLKSCNYILINSHHENLTINAFHNLETVSDHISISDINSLTMKPDCFSKLKYADRIYIASRENTSVDFSKSFSNLDSIGSTLGLGWYFNEEDFCPLLSLIEDASFGWKLTVDGFVELSIDELKETCD